MARSNKTRRQFLQTSAAAGIGYFTLAGVAPRVSSAAAPLNFASIGVGGKGESDTDDAGRRGNLVAICDIDVERLDKMGTRYPKAKKYQDYRKMLDEMGMMLDGVTVSTPDHTHAPAAVRAMQMGIHCFCQKPMTHTIGEARLMGRIARDKKLVTQMGNQGTAESNLRKSAAIIRSGALGPVSEVHVWTNRPVWPQGEARPQEAAPVPAHIDWDLWIGAAEMRPYSPIYHPFKWRGWWAFGTGALGDMACHTLNMPYMGLDLRDPVAVQATTSGHDGDFYPKWSVIKYEFAARGDRGPLVFYWYDGGKLPPAEKLQGAKLDSSGTLVVGAKGSLYSPGDYAGAEPQLLGVDAPKVDFTRSPGHFDEWVRGIENGDPSYPVSNFPDYASPLTETVLLGNLAVWVDGERVEWDSENLTAKCSKDVTHLINKPYRKGFELNV